ncbi:MAG: DUF4091 domain-containing protein [Kiritimatiellaeota bacterium]|nr:DUF4091 domain-containing protein [Kiritimatiellota bacterium]
MHGWTHGSNRTGFRRSGAMIVFSLFALLGTSPVRGGFRGEFVAPAAAGNCNLLSNGGFEQGGILPVWWGRHPARDNGRNVHARDTKVAHSGRASARIEWWDPIAGKNKSPLQWSRYGLPVVGGKSLIVSGFARTQGVQAAGAGLHFYGARGNHLGFRPVAGPANARNWAPFCAEVPVPEQAVKAGFVLYTRQGGITWYDDLILLGTPRVEARRASPRVDGVLDDPCWDAKSAVTAFVRHDGSGAGTESTRAWVTYDDQALYVAFDCPHPRGARLKAEATVHDGRTWLDDSIEVFLVPWKKRAGYEHIMVNCRGIVRDAFAQQTDWESGVVVGVRRAPDRWTVELRIPYEGLGLGLDTGREWGMNLVRNDRVNGETVTWSLGGFHDPARFGTVRLEPNLAPWVARALRQETSRLRERLATTRRQADTARLTPESHPETFRRLRQAAASLERLAAAVRTPDALPGVAIQELEGMTASIKADLRAVQRQTVAALFRAGPVGDPEAFHVTPCRSTVKVRRDGPFPDAWVTPLVTLEAARDESESFQLVIEPGKSGLKQVTLEPCELRNDRGEGLPLAWRRILYIETAPPRGYRAAYVGWWPDILAPAGPFAVPAGERRPVWCRVDVPPGARPGVYRGRVVVKGDGRRTSVPVRLTVRSFRLPRPGTLPCAFGLYAGVLSRWYHGRKPYEQVMSPEVYARWCRFMGRYRLTPKNVGNEYRKKTPKGWDLSALRTTIGDLASKYYPPYSFCVYRLSCARDVQTGKTKADPKIWIDTVKQISGEYRRLGLPEQAYIYGVDEPAIEGYPFLRKLYSMLRETVPEFPIMQTVNHAAPTGLSGLVGIWCPLSSQLEADYAFYRKRLTAGDRVWMYVCCGPKPPYANFFVDQPGLDHRVLFWQAWQKQVTGVLYWCVCWWAGIPGPTSDQTHFPAAAIHLKEAGSYRDLGVNGDGILIWPGPNMTPWPSQRLEIIRDGIEDYEYLALLSRTLKSAQDLPTDRRPRPELLTKAQGLLEVPPEISRSFTDYCKAPEILTARRHAVAEMIERLATAAGAPRPTAR